LDRNYHIFYELLKGAPADALKKLFLVDEKGNRLTKDGFVYLKPGIDDFPLNLINDVERYEELVEKLDKELNFTNDEQDTIWKIVASVLHLGNVELDTSTYDPTKSIF